MEIIGPGEKIGSPFDTGISLRISRLPPNAQYMWKTAKPVKTKVTKMGMPCMKTPRGIAPFAQKRQSLTLGLPSSQSRQGACHVTPPY